MAPRPVKLTIATAVEQIGIKQAIASLERLGGQINKVGTGAARAAAGFVAFKAAQAGLSVVQQAYTQARDLERSMAGLKLVFEELTPEMEAFTKGATQLGLSQAEAAKSATFIGSVLKQSGIEMELNAKQTQRLVSLASDLAFVYGYDVTEALSGMTALFRGEYDPIEKFGVAMKQSEVNSELAALGLDKLEGSARRNAEAYIRMNMMLDRASDAEGAFADNTQSLYVQQEILQSTFNNVMATVGTGLLPVFTRLVAAITPLVEKLTPLLTAAFESLIPVVDTFANNTDEMAKSFINAFNAGTKILGFLANLSVFIINNFDALVKLATQIGITIIAFKGLVGAIALFNLLSTAIGGTTNKLKGLKIALASTGIGLLAVGIGALAEKFLFAEDAANDAANALINFDNIAGMTGTGLTPEGLIPGSDFDTKRPKNLQPGYQETFIGRDDQWYTRTWNGTKWVIKKMADAYELPSEPDSGAAKAKPVNPIKQFYDNLAEEVIKQRARLRLLNLGATEGLADAIISSGEGWYKVYLDLLKKGQAGVEALQNNFNKTAEGLKDQEALKEFTKSVYDFVESITNITSAIDPLRTFEREIGKFERSAVDSLNSVEDALRQAFKGEKWFDAAREELIAYARTEYEQLIKIQRQRDQLLERRDLADKLINQVRSSVSQVEKLTGLLDASKEAEITETSRGLVRIGRDLKEFDVIITKSYTEKMQAASGAANQLVTEYRKVVERTRAFVSNLKELKRLGLDPQLFNQLVEAGVEAGGETAQALIDGGADTIKEMNGLFTELDSLGKTFGEQLATEMYGQGVNVTNGLINGMDSMLAALEASAFNLGTTIKDAIEEALGGVAQTIINKPMIDLENITKLNQWIASAQKYIKNVQDPFARLNAQAKLEIYQGLKADVLAGNPVDLSGITPGMSLEALGAASGNPAYNVTNNITVTAGMGADGATIGREVVDAIITFERSSGPVFMRAV
jgi:hypothetical protein